VAFYQWQQCAFQRARNSYLHLGSHPEIDCLATIYLLDRDYFMPNESGPVKIELHSCGCWAMDEERTPSRQWVHFVRGRAADLHRPHHEGACSAHPYYDVRAVPATRANVVETASPDGSDSSAKG
jgi:hypothetical protein